MRYITVPYAITLLNLLTKNQLDLYKIWKAQEVSDSIKSLLYVMMSSIEPFIKSTAPGGLYGEWAKKEDCWIQVKEKEFGFDLTSIKKDLIDKKNPPKRIIISEDDSEMQKRKEDLEKIKSIPPSVWKKIDEWGRSTGNLSDNQQSITWNLSSKIRTNSPILQNEITNGISIIEKVIDNAPQLLYEIDDFSNMGHPENIVQISLDLLKQIVQWDKKNKKLKDFEFIFMKELAEGKKPLSEHNLKIALWNLGKVKKYGFIRKDLPA